MKYGAKFFLSFDRKEKENCLLNDIPMQLMTWMKTKQ